MAGRGVRLEPRPAERGGEQAEETERAAVPQLVRDRPGLDAGLQQLRGQLVHARRTWSGT